MHNSTPGRPRILDKSKQREICNLLAAGCSLREAARLLGCNHKTIHREAQRNDVFREMLRSAQRTCQLSPLRAMQQAMGTHWRAAAWMLERTRPQRFARRVPRNLTAREARQLIGDVLTILSEEIPNEIVVRHVSDRVRTAMIAALQHTWNNRYRSSRRRPLDPHDHTHGTSGHSNRPAPALGAPRLPVQPTSALPTAKRSALPAPKPANQQPLGTKTQPAATACPATTQPIATAPPNSPAAAYASQPFTAADGFWAYCPTP